MQVRLTPSVLAWLRSFEATARNLSFTRAAAEIYVTQGAVSQQVKQLESWLDCVLLIRKSSGLSLTPEGQLLAEAVAESYGAIEAALQEVRPKAADAPFFLNCSPSFAIAWLTPRLGDFFVRNSRIGLRVTGEFHALDRERMARENIDAALRYDLGAYPDLRAETILDEWLVPVASPQWLERQGANLANEQLRPEMLLHDTKAWAGASPYEEWAHWTDAVQMDTEGWDWGCGQHFNLAQLAVAAASNSQGVAMGRLALVFEELKAGRLVVAVPRAVRARAAYHLVTSDACRSQVLAVRDWLSGQARRFGEERGALLETLATR